MYDIITQKLIIVWVWFAVLWNLCLKYPLTPPTKILDHASSVKTSMGEVYTNAWATTIHKGLILDEIVVDMKGGRISPGQAYAESKHCKAYIF